MIDRQLNYGRHLIKRFAGKAVPFHNVLDLGAGHGDDLLIAKHVQPDATLQAIENYEPYAKELESTGIDVFESNLERDSLPFENESVDLIICNQILEHCKEVWWIFHEISRVLKVNGKLIIGVPNLASLHNRVLLAVGEQPTAIKNNSAHVRGYTKNDMIRLLHSGFGGGYKLIDFGGSNYYPFPRTIARPLAALFPTSAWGIFFLFEKKAKYVSGFLDYPQSIRIETNFYYGRSVSS